MIATYPAIRLAICWPSVVWTEKFLFLKSPKSTEKIFSLNTHLFTVVKGNDSLTSLESKSSLKMESLVTPSRRGTNFLFAGSYKKRKVSICHKKSETEIGYYLILTLTTKKWTPNVGRLLANFTYSYLASISVFPFRSLWRSRIFFATSLALALKPSGKNCFMLI